jgi:hypothetical protein
VTLGDCPQVVFIRGIHDRSAFFSRVEIGIAALSSAPVMC